MSEYTQMLANSSPDDVKAALGALSDESHRKLVEVLNGMNEPTKTLAEYAVAVSVVNPADLDTTIAGLAPENREKIEGALSGMDPIEEPNQEAKDVPVEVGELEDPLTTFVLEVATPKATGRFCC